MSFINSDPDLIRFFLRFLDATGTARTDLRFRIYIHESADVATAQRFWLEIRPLSQDRRMGGVEHGGAPRREPGTGSQAVARRGIGRYRHGIAAGIVGTTLTVMSHNRLYQQSGVE